MEELKKEITGTVQQINAVVELFYQQKNQEAYAELENMLTTLMHTIDNIFAYKGQHEEFVFDEKGLAEVLQTTLSAMEDKDSILMADILKYDVIEKLEAIC